MARPKKIGLDYFPHDCDASGDEKLEPIEALYGNDGYAVYFKILERIYRAGGALDFSDPDMSIMIAKKCNLTIERFNVILEKMLDKDLFLKNEFVRKKVLTSAGIKKRISPIRGKRLKWLKKKKKVFSGENPDNGGVFSGENPPETPESKVKKSKVKKSINTPPISPQGGLPDWIPQEAWFGFLEMREQKKKKPTARAKKIILDKLDQWRQRGHDPTEILNTATVNGWTDIYEPKAQGGKNGTYQRDNQTARTAAGGIRGDASVYDAVTERFIDEDAGSG